MLFKGRTTRDTLRPSIHIQQVWLESWLYSIQSKTCWQNKIGDPSISVLFDAVELQHVGLSHKIIDKGLVVIHCERSLHFILAENLNLDDVCTDKNKIRCQMAKVFSTIDKHCNINMRKHHCK